MMIKKKVKSLDVQEFDSYLEEIRHNWLKTLTAVGFILIPIFLALDYFMIPATKIPSFATYRGVVTILLLIQHFILRYTKPSAYSTFHGYFFSIAVGIMISLMTKELGGFDSSYYAGLNLVMFASIVMVPWGFANAVINALLVIGSYLFFNIIFPNPFTNSILLNNIYFLSSTAVIAVAINRVQSGLIWKEFYIRRELNIAKNEQDTIMNAVEEGLFVIHKKADGYFVGEHQSEAVEKILTKTPLSGKKFTDVLSPYFSPAKIEEVDEFLKMISSENVFEKNIRELNPLERVEAVVQTGLNSLTKHLEFDFKRIIQAHNKTDFLISIKDATREVELARQLHEIQVKSEQESQMMLSILHIGPALLQDFIEGVEAELSVIESVLRDEEQHKDLLQTIEAIFRAVHSIKGNSAMVDLKFLAEKANEFEEKVIVLRDKKEISSEDFLPIAFELARLQEVYKGMQELIKRIRSFQGKTGENESALSTLPNATMEFAERIAEEQGKKVKMDFITPDFTGVSNKYAYVLRDILVQLTRNSITHGIETPETRIGSGKVESGAIFVTMLPKGNNYIIVFRDDGKSFDFDAIRARALKLEKDSEHGLAKWESLRLIKLIFDPGFSTSQDLTMHAGRGMGMDIIKQRVKKIGGRLSINFAIGRFTEFKFTFPMKLLQT
ncbi:MAG: Hpt domain-containing protein [Leptospira sp.]|nr:Hpt domain-containing protein [Leptospira sp.]